MEPESTGDLAPMDDFERELREAMQRRPSPSGLKSAVLVRRSQERAVRQRQWRAIWHGPRIWPGSTIWFDRLAASLVLAAVVGAAVFWRNAEERRRGDEAKQQVFTALRITNHALAEMNVQLNQRDRNAQ